MKIECSRQLCAEQTDRHTDKVTPWAPSRSQKVFIKLFLFDHQPASNRHRSIRVIKAQHYSGCYSRFVRTFESIFHLHIVRPRNG